MIKHYNQIVKNTQFQVGDLVLGSNEASQVEKMHAQIIC